MWFDIIKLGYDTKAPRYDNEGLKVFVKAAMLTEEEYKRITGIDYEQ